MAKLYLIRRNLETFTGPMTLSEMKEAYKRMAFGLQDEVSGHCGPWVSFDNLPEIKKYYPEIARIVNEDMLAGWGVSDHGVRIPNEDTKRIEVKQSKGIGLALTFLVIALVAFVAAVYMANGSRMSGKAGPDSDLKPEDLQQFLDKNDANGFEAYMADHGPELADRVSRPKKPEPQWLPYLRHWAFAHEGMVSGLPPKLLRGDGAPMAPIDCSLKMWRRRWRASLKGWNDFIAQKKLVRQHWARVLAWDPHWIRRRDNKGWLGQENYYVGCLVMAQKSLAELYNDPSLVTSAADWDKIGINKVKQRVDWLTEVTATGQSSQSTQPQTGNGLSVWTCYEAARDVKDLQKCRDTLGNAPSGDEVWQAYNDERLGWSLLRIAAAQKGSLAPELLAALTNYSQKTNKTDHFTRFDYRAELKLMKALVKQGQPVEKTVEKTQAEYPDVKLSH